jgi:uncharacterized membrane protein (DUF106 family)
LTAWLTGKAKKETEIRTLKEEAQKAAAECRALAEQGDPAARKRLKKLEETITEQSIRLTGHKKPPSTCILPPGTVKP